jgi:carbamate kinase
MLVVVALGGNALLQRHEKPDATVERGHVARAARALGSLVNQERVVLCHGNGPQVGLLAAESQADPTLSRPYPLDALGAQTQGMIGYWLSQELHNAGVTRPVAVVVTQTVVEEDDPAFARPTKFIGACYSESDAKALGAARGWTMGAAEGCWRRLVPSPAPRRLVEIGTLRTLAEAGTVVICAGGGGAPVVQTASGDLVGVDAVVDKDLSAAMLADQLGADRLILLTDVPAVYRDFGTPDAAPIHSTSIDALSELTFPAGSMGPKVEACRQFLRSAGRRAAIGALEDAAAVVAGQAGTTITATG